MKPVEIIRGNGPIILGLPHTGTHVPTDIWDKLNQRGQKLSDTDWHIEKLYDNLMPDITSVRATFHRYVIDANRDPEGNSLYPGQNTTGLVALTDFDGHAIWKIPPADQEIVQRLQTYHTPYHAALEAELKRIHALHGVAILYDCHSIRSHIPFLFEGVLPDFNIGTNSGTTCAAVIEAAVLAICTKADGYSSILNGRFKGGWTTRHYGRTQKNWHAIQMELAQKTHLKSEVAPWAIDDIMAAKLRKHLTEILVTLAALAPDLKAAP